jgi:AraC-like DNA-binding protein
MDGLARAIAASVVSSASEGDFGDLLAGALELLHNDYAYPWSVGDLAERAGCSEGHFHRLFKERTGKTPIAYLTDRRMEMAQQMLRGTSLSVSRIAALVGYDDPLYFSRVFRRIVGHCPSAGRC